MVTAEGLVERFSALLQLTAGDGKAEIKGLASPETATQHSLIFIGDKKHLEPAVASKATTWVVSKPMLDVCLSKANGRTVLVSPNTQLAMALIGKSVFPQNKNRVPFQETPIHPTAVIHPSVKLGSKVVIGPNTTIGAGVSIGEETIIGPNTTIEPGVEIGQRCHIHAQVYIAFDCKIGSDCEIHPQTSIGTEGFGYAHDQSGAHRLSHYGRVVIEDRVHIGAGVQIDRGTFEDSRFGYGTIIDNHCHFGHNFKCGKGNIFTGGFLASGSVTVGDRCVFGGRTSVAGHLSIVSGCQFAGLSGISFSVTEPGAYGGYPIIPLKEALKVSSSLAHLPKLRRKVKSIMTHLGLKDEADA